jgi:uncharacterized protein YidB (DUF937 family)
VNQHLTRAGPAVSGARSDCKAAAGTLQKKEDSSMSTIAEVIKIFEGSNGDTQQRSLIVETVSLLTNRAGGINALVRDFEQNGLGHVISSWIGNGNNAGISADQLSKVLGSQRIAELAKRAGVAPEKVCDCLSASLPNLVDAMTPDGKLGSAGQLQSRGRQILAAFNPLKSAS